MNKITYTLTLGAYSIALLFMLPATLVLLEDGIIGRSMVVAATVIGVGGWIVLYALTTHALMEGRY